ncbi:MAG: glycosyltransferase family 4 protein [Bacteroidales bacterium]|nr:glycosyltransferase family 4 protein [Bacteroidales bacterium]MCF8390258.1 glycosyltransferase family 4 protein [Bacteroidales bacterium]
MANNKSFKICRFYPVFQDEFWYSEHYLAKEFSKEGIRTTFVTSNRYRKSWLKYLQKLYSSGHYNFEHYDIFRIKAFFPMEQTIFINWYRLFKLLFRNENTIIHLYGYGTLATLQIFLVSLFSGKKSPPMVFSDHTNSITNIQEGAFANFFYKVMGGTLNLFKNKYHTIITFSEAGKQVISKRFKIPKDKIQIIPLGYDQDTYFYRPDRKNTESKLVVGFAGKIGSQKRLDFLINQLSSEEFINKVKLIIIGITNDPYCNSLKTQAKETGLETDFRPFANSKSLSEFYNLIDLAIFPGSISITTIEANGCGTPVLIYESIEGLSERVIDGRGMLFKDENEFIDRMRSFIRLYETKEIMNSRIEMVTRNKSSWGVIKEQYKAVYTNCLNYENNL